MAKQKQPEDAVPESPATAEDISLARRAVMDCTGCGEPAAIDRVAKWTPSRIAKVAELERTGKRVDIVTLLFGA